MGQPSPMNHSTGRGRMPSPNVLPYNSQQGRSMRSPFPMESDEPTRPRSGRRQFTSSASCVSFSSENNSKTQDETLTMTSSQIKTTKSDLDKPFHQLYQSYCRRGKVEPLDFIISNSVSRNALEIDVDLIPIEHWKRVNMALRNSRQNFSAIRLAWGKSNYVRDFSTLSKVSKSTNSTPSTLSIKESMMIHQMRSTNQLERKTSSRTINLVDKIDYSDSLKLIRVMSPCFSGMLSRLEIIGIPLSKQCTSFMQKGLTEASHSLRALSLCNTGLGDEAFKEIGSILSSFIKLSKLQLSGCELSDDSASYILNVMKERINQKSHESWLTSLRGEQEIGETVEDFVALDLSNNFFSDSLAKALSHVLYDDQTLKSK